MSENESAEKASLLKSAIKSEIDGFTFYDLLAREVDNSDAKRRLESLRDDEARHRVRLIELYRKHVGGEPGALPAEGVSPLEEAFVKGGLKKFKSEVEYINLAIKAEIAAAKFYKEGAASIDETDFKDILEQLADEENGHYEILMAEREALAGNYYWFIADGTSAMED
jgi:rubrerythrin